MLEAAWQQRGDCGSVSGGGGSAKHGRGAQRDSGSTVAEAQRLRRWQQCNSMMLAPAWQRRGHSGSIISGGGNAPAQCWRKLGGGSAAVHGGSAISQCWRWQQHNSTTLVACKDVGVGVGDNDEDKDGDIGGNRNEDEVVTKTTTRQRQRLRGLR